MFLIGVPHTRQPNAFVKKKRCIPLANFWVALGYMSCVLYFLHNSDIGFSVRVPMLILLPHSTPEMAAFQGRADVLLVLWHLSE